jgi:hypothetical protein
MNSGRQQKEERREREEETDLFRAKELYSNTFN